MAPQPESEPEQSGASGDARTTGTRTRFPRRGWSRLGRLDLADNVDRMAGDVNLVTDLALQEYKGPLWDYFSNELAKYGYRGDRQLDRPRMIFERCKSKGFGGLPILDRPFTEDENEELTNETVAKALVTSAPTY